MTAAADADDLLGRAFWSMWDEDPPAGDIRLRISDQHADVFTRDSSVALVEQTLTPVVKYATWIPVTNELLDDANAFRSMMAAAADRHLRPWRYPDRPKISTFDLFPRVTRVRHAVTAAAHRCSTAWRTLRHNDRFDVDWDDE